MPVDQTTNEGGHMVAVAMKLLKQAIQSLQPEKTEGAAFNAAKEKILEARFFDGDVLIQIGMIPEFYGALTEYLRESDVLPDVMAALSDGTELPEVVKMLFLGYLWLHEQQPGEFDEWTVCETNVPVSFRLTAMDRLVEKAENLGDDPRPLRFLAAPYNFFLGQLIKREEVGTDVLAVLKHLLIVDSVNVLKLELSADDLIITDANKTLRERIDAGKRLADIAHSLGGTPRPVELLTTPEAPGRFAVQNKTKLLSCQPQIYLTPKSNETSMPLSLPDAHFETTFYGPSNGKNPDLLILDQHGGTHHFLDHHPEIIEASAVDEQTLRRYVTLEQDFGSMELSQAIAKKVIDMMSEARVQIINITHPRGLIEPQRRDFDQAFKPIFDRNKFPQAAQKLASIHHTTQEVLHHELQQNRARYLLDNHTMAPYSPVEPIILSPDAVTIRKYMEGHAEAVNHPKQRRPFDVILGRSEGPQWAHPSLTRNLIQGLTEHQIVHATNTPYATREGMLSDYLLQTGKTLLVDVPKDLLTTFAAEDPRFDLFDPELSSHQIDHMATIFAEAIVKTLQG